MLGHKDPNALTPRSKVISGDDLLSLLQRPDTSKGSKDGSKTISLAALYEENQHEVVALVPSSHMLTINYSNWNRLRSEGSAEEPTLVISFLGDTEVGKSHTIRELMGPSESRPFVQASRDQRASTTANVNLYACHSMVGGCTVHFLDFEGEHGSEAPMALFGGSGMGPSSSSASASSAAASALASATPFSASALFGGAFRGEERGAGAPQPPQQPLPRSAAVREVFPKLAYTTSDVIAMVGTEPFFSTRYLERVVSLATRANSGVGDADLPILLLLCNRRDADACLLDIKASTAQFYEAMGEAAAQLDQYFSAILAVYLPNKRSCIVVESSGSSTTSSTTTTTSTCAAAGAAPAPPLIMDGAALFAEQIGKVRACLGALMQSRLMSRYGGSGEGSSSGSSSGGVSGRSISSRQGLWYELLPRVVREINAGRNVSVMRLVDEAWSAAITGSSASATTASAEPPLGDVLKSFAIAVRPPPFHPSSPSAPALFLARFEAHLHLACDLALRCAAARLRAIPPALRIPARTRKYARSALELMLEIVEGAAPCRAVLPESVGAGASCAGVWEGGAPASASAPVGVHCLQEKRAHRKGHRGCQKVRGGGRSLWARLANSLMPYTPVWSGAWEAPLVTPPNLAALTEACCGAAVVGAREWLLELAALQGRHREGRGVVYAEIVEEGGVGRFAGSSSSSSSKRAGAGLVLSAQAVSSSTHPHCIACARRVLGGGAAAAAAAAAAAEAVPSGYEGEEEGSSSGGAEAPTFTSSFFSFLGLAAAPKPREGGEGKAAAAAGAAEAPVVLGICAQCCQQAVSLGVL